MKKSTIRVVAVILLICFSLLNANTVALQAASKAQQSYKVTLDGKPLNISVISKNGTLYFQLETLLKNTGWSYKFSKFSSSGSQYVEMKKGDNYSFFFSDYDSISVYCDSKSKTYKTWGTKLDKKMFVSNKYLYVPLKFVKEIIRLDVTTKSNVVTLKTMKDHTLLVYIIASDLESNIGPGNPEGAATLDLKELMSVGSTNKVNVVVQTGGTSKWNNNIIKGTSVKRWYVQKGNMKMVSDLGEKNMGDPKDLEEFIKWSMATYPSESYTLLLWDHGGGPLFGYGYDELSKDKLSMKELKSAIGNAYKVTNKKFATIGFDACIMNTLEVADMLTPYASYMIASQVPLPAHGFDYSCVVPLLEKDTDPLYPNFPTKLVDQFETYATKMGTIDDMELSCIDLNYLKNVMPQFETFMSKLNKDIDIDPMLAYDLAIARADDYDYKDENITGDGNDLTNLSTFLWRIGEVANGKYRDDIYKLRNSLDSSVRGLIKGKNVISLNGMSIYMPSTQFANSTYVKDYLSLYKDIGFSKAYTSLIEKYYKKIMLEDCTIDIIKNVTPGTFNYYYEAYDPMLLEVSQDSLRKINSINSIVEVYNNDLGRNIIESSYPSYFFRDETEIRQNPNIFKLNGNYVSMIYEGQLDSNLKLFTIPINLNDELAKLYVIGEGFDTHYIAGVQLIQENESGMASKRVVKLKSTDIVEPIFLSRGQNGEIEMVKSNNKFNLEDGKIEKIYVGDFKGKIELYHNIELFNKKTIETNHVIVDSTNN